MADRIVLRLVDAAKKAIDGLDAPTDFPEFLDRLGLLGLLARIYPDPSRIPHLRAALLKNKMTVSVLVARAREIATALERRKVRHFFAKGIALIGNVYRAGERAVADIDLYVVPEDRERTISILESLGFTAVPDEDQSGPPELRSTIALLKNAGVDIDSVVVDLHWGLNPVQKLLPRSDHEVPDCFWGQLERVSGISIPNTGQHAALLVHHLVGSDLLHVRSLVDLAYLYQSFDDEHAAAFVNACQDLSVMRPARWLCEIIVKDFGVSECSVGWPPGSEGDLYQKTNLDGWMARVARTPDRDFYEVTPARIMRRGALLGGLGSWFSLLSDVVLPPREFVAWRAPAAKLPAAYVTHYVKLVRKMVGGGQARSP